MDKKNISNFHKKYSSWDQFKKADKEFTKKKTLKENKNGKLNKSSSRNNKEYRTLTIKS